MKCTTCKKGRMVEKTALETVEIDGAPTFEIEGVTRLECDSCHDTVIDMVNARAGTKKILAKLIQYYGPRMDEVPGKVVYWMRHAMDLSQTELAEEVSGMDPSTLAHATTRNTKIDKYAAFVLLSLAADFVTGKKAGRELIEKTKIVDSILGRASYTDRRKG